VELVHESTLKTVGDKMEESKDNFYIFALTQSTEIT
jgi:hypothetical protein